MLTAAFDNQSQLVSKSIESVENVGLDHSRFLFGRLMIIDFIFVGCYSKEKSFGAIDPNNAIQVVDAFFRQESIVFKI